MDDKFIQELDEVRNRIIADSMKLKSMLTKISDVAPGLFFNEPSQMSISNCVMVSSRIIDFVSTIKNCSTQGDSTNAAQSKAGSGKLG